MALSDNMRLYDIATRKQVYVEQVKLRQAREFNSVLNELRTELKRLLGKINYKTLDGLTKAELNKFIAALRASQSRIYSAYTQQIINQLKEFMQADLQVSRQAYVFARLEFAANSNEEASTSAKKRPLELVNDSQAVEYMQEENESNADFTPLFGIAAVTDKSERLWSSVTNSPIPANGLYLLPFIKTFATSAQAGVENLIRMGYANGWTVDETLQQLTGEGNKQGTSSQLQRISVQAAAVIATGFQHVTAITSAAVMSALFNWYTWHSVMDNKTTDICISRNLKIYRFGEGPLPPAHIRCRSHVSPIVGRNDIKAESFYGWLNRQPSKVQNDVLGFETADKLRSRNLKQADLKKFEPREALTIDGYKRKIEEIVSS